MWVCIYFWSSVKIFFGGYSRGWDIGTQTLSGWKDLFWKPLGVLLAESLQLSAFFAVGLGWSKQLCSGVCARSEVAHIQRMIITAGIIKQAYLLNSEKCWSVLQTQTSLRLWPRTFGKKKKKENYTQTSFNQSELLQQDTTEREAHRQHKLISQVKCQGPVSSTSGKEQFSGL